MSSSKSKLSIPEVTEGSSVTEMISLLRCSFQQKEYDEVERLLICREEKLLMELNNLRKDFDLMKKDRDSLEKAHGMAELNKLSMEQDLKRCKHDCEESREELNRLRAEYEASIAKKNQELDEVRRDRNKMVEKLICEKCNAEETVSLLKGHLKKFGGKVFVLEENVAKLLALDVLQVRRGISFQEVDVEVQGSFPLSSAAMESSVNEGLSDGKDVSASKGESGGLNVKYLQNSVNDHVEGENVGYVVKKLQNGSNTHLEETAVTAFSIGLGSPRSQLPHNATGTENPALTSANTFCSKEMDVQEGLSESENSAEEAATRIPVAKGPLSPIIVEISDSEDESLAVGSSDEVNPIGKKIPLQEEDRTQYLKDSFIDSMLNRKRRPTDFDDVGNCKVARRKTTDSAVLFHDTDESSGGEDFESYMENKVAKFKRYNESTWKFAAQMLSAFEKDYELCMKAVCALYRKKISAEKSKIDSLIPGDLVLFHFDAMSGKALAEYLIDGDPQNKLKKTVLEVQQENPKVLSQCKDLAIHYSEKLFDIYTKGRDRFFRPDL